MTDTDWSPIAAKDGRASRHIFTTRSGVFSLSGLDASALTLHILDLDNNNALYVCTGGWSITDAGSGKATFTPSPTDLLSTNPLGKPGGYDVYPVVTLASGPVPMDAQYLKVVNLP